MSSAEKRTRGRLFAALFGFFSAGALRKELEARYNCHDEWQLISGGSRCT
ncbi:hypothetical protein BACCAP_04348 [Pseudoflavonifractor capillosus ATCC 29799]|uniref:Uncharacterized protein n=1 Tax=Pseudoflavonifractor capillosus ATCC 29799 TaxID=411467 RepID=A6P1I1_9FIRM|nr:hypothetical protein BACCAP_04348 [Pseudoflavonifractor capillosus ATCC 29799]